MQLGNPGMVRLVRLPDSFGNLSNLQHLALSECVSLTSLPDRCSSLGSLGSKYMIITH
jgi:hypothetical protein